MNKLAKFDAAADITNSQIFDNGTRVGIGNTTPAAKLDVTGNSIFRGPLQLPATATATSTAGTNSQSFNLIASAFNSNTSAAVNQHFRLQAEPVGNNTSSPSGKLSLLFASGLGTPTETGLSINSRGIFTAPLGMLLHHASFQGATQTVTGFNSRIIPFDGLVFIQTGIDLSDVADITSDSADTAPFPGLDKPGTFLSLRLKLLLEPVSNGAAYFIAGGTDSGGTALQDGFGFKFVGGGDLNGVTILNGTESTVDLATTLGFSTTDPPLNLLAVRRATSVDFYANGVLKGTITTNLPSTSFSIYELRLKNGSTQMGGQSWAVSFLTVGIPMF